MARETTKQRNARIARDNARRDVNETRRVEAQAALERSRAEASAAIARAEAEKARVAAETKRIEAEAAAAKRKSDAEQAEREAKAAREPMERNYQLALAAGAPLLGYVAGAKLAASLTKKHAAGIAAANIQLASLSTAAIKAMPKAGKPSATALAKLGGIVKAADAAKLATRPAALGLATAGIILAEGAFARFVIAPKLSENKVAMEAAGAVGTASIFAATTMIGKRLIANATTTALPDAKSVAVIEAARNMFPKSSATAPAAPASTVTKAVKVAASVSKAKAAAVALAAGGVAAVAVAASNSAQARGAPGVPAAATAGASIARGADMALTTASTATAVRLATSPGVRAAAGLLSKLALPVTAAVAVAGAVSGYQKTGTFGGTLEGAADGVTGGGYSALRDMISASLKSAPPATAATGNAAVALMRDASGRVFADMRSANTLAPSKSSAPSRSDGRTDGYTRTQNGKTVFVKGYQTPAR